VGPHSISNERLRKAGHSVGTISQTHRYILPAGERLRFYLKHITSRNDQETPLGTGVLDDCSKEPVDELLEVHFARKRLRDFNLRRDPEIGARLFDRARRLPRPLVLPQMRIEPIELPHLSVGAPSKITLSCVSQVKVRDLLESACRVKVRGQLVGKRRIMDEAIISRRADSLLIQLLGIERTAFDPGDLGANKRGAIFEVFRTIALPRAELPVMSGQCIDMLLSLLGRGCVAESGASERSVELVFRAFPVRRRGPHQRLCLA